MAKAVYLLFLFPVTLAFSQTVPQRLAKAVQQLESDTQMKHAMLSLCVVDAKTGKQLYAHNAQTGLAAGSTQKIFTSGAAFDLLGHDFRYRTSLGYRGKIVNGVLQGNLYIIGSFDPTMGSWRFNDCKEEKIIREWVKEIKDQHIQRIQGIINIFSDSRTAIEEQIPDGWIWQDIGNYYGAGADMFNWRENQYDLILHPGNSPGDTVRIIGTLPKLFNVRFINLVTTGEAGSGDNAYIYLPAYADWYIVKGTIPEGEKDFTISGAIVNPSFQVISTLNEVLKQEGIEVDSARLGNDADKSFTNPIIIGFHDSPSLDSINYWFLKKSINLYGEALIKTIASKKDDPEFVYRNGVFRVKDFWSRHGIDKAAVNICDGSGLSPQNRVTTDAEVKVLQYAKSRPWFSSFYNALPEFNGMKMKSGAIGGARAFAGYHTAKDGKQYIFSIIVNNFDGASGEIVKKMYRVLDVMK